jgi:RNA polymerase subunit RPABC4/transcription elongation factor Spt4
MGNIYGFKCGCGYEKKARIGEGRTGMNVNTIREIFTPDELSEFENALSSGITDYSLSKKIAFCRKCGDLVNADALRYAVGGLTKIIVKACINCNDILFPCDINVICPRCGCALLAEQEGFWD